MYISIDLNLFHPCPCNLSQVVTSSTAVSTCARDAFLLVLGWCNTLISDIERFSAPPDNSNNVSTRKEYATSCLVTAPWVLGKGG